MIKCYKNITVNYNIQQQVRSLSNRTRQKKRIMYVYLKSEISGCLIRIPDGCQNAAHSVGITDGVYFNSLSIQRFFHGRPRTESDCHNDCVGRNLLFIRAVFHILNKSACTRGALHGGILATALDVCLGALCRYVSGWVECPTVQLRVDYHLPVPAERLLLIEAQLESAHPPMYSATGWICVKGKPQHRLVTATASFYASSSRDKCL